MKCHFVLYIIHHLNGTQRYLLSLWFLNEIRGAVFALLFEIPKGNFTMMSRSLSTIQMSTLKCLSSKCVRKTRTKNIAVSQKTKCILCKRGVVSLILKFPGKKSQAPSCTPVTPYCQTETEGSPGLTGLPTWH